MTLEIRWVEPTDPYCTCEACKDACSLAKVKQERRDVARELGRIYRLTNTIDAFIAIKKLAEKLGGNSK